MRNIIEKIMKLFRRRGELKHQCRWIMAAAKPCLPRLLVLFSLQCGMSVLSVGMTLVNKTIIDRAIAASGRFDTRAFVLLVGLTLINLLLGSFGGYAASMVSERFTFSLRSQLYRRVLHSKWEALKGYHSGDVQTRLTGDLDTVASGICSLVPETLGLVLRLLLAFAVLYNYDHMLALAALVLGPFGLICGLLFTGKMHRYQVLSRENESAVRSFMQ